MSKELLHENDTELMRLWKELHNTEPGTPKYNQICQSIVALNGNRTVTQKEMVDEEVKRENLETEKAIKAAQQEMERESMNSEKVFKASKLEIDRANMESERAAKAAQLELERERLNHDIEAEKADKKRKWAEILTPAVTMTVLGGIMYFWEEYGHSVIPKVWQFVTRGVKPHK